jgi:hypothetical protein
VVDVSLGSVLLGGSDVWQPKSASASATALASFAGRMRPTESILPVVEADPPGVSKRRYRVIEARPVPAGA